MKPTALLALPLFPLVQAAINWDVYEYGVVPTFRWSRPFPDDGSDPMGFHINCRHSATFHAKQYKLKDLPDEPPTGLAPWKDAIEVFLRQRDYVGSWDGVDHKGLEREVVVMEWLDVPEAVRTWIEQQQRGDGVVSENKWLFGVFRKPKGEGDKVYTTVKPRALPTQTPLGDGVEETESVGEQQQQEQPQAQADKEEEKVPEVEDKDKIVVFPAGAIYEILPLWAAQGSGCERDLHNLAHYKTQAIDHAVLAWPVDHTKPHRDLGKRDITFKIEAMTVTETESAKNSRLMWERMHRMIKRNERRQQREERERAKREIKMGGSVRDEL